MSSATNPSSVHIPGQSQRPSGEPIPPSAVSVVIPAWNAARTISFQLEALATQVDAPPFEVIVADNASTDDTRAVAESFSHRLDLRVVDASAVRGPAFARNTGAAAARTTRLLFCDADDRVGERWVRAMADALERHGMVTGPIVYVDALPRGGAPPVPRRLRTEPRRYLDQIPFATSNNLAIRADLFRHLGGFDTELQCGEDAHFTIRAQIAGTALAWAQDAVVFNVRRPSLAGTAIQFYRYGFYRALVYRKLRGNGLSRPSAWQMLRPYLNLAATAYRLLTRQRRSWVSNAAQRAGCIAGSVRFRVLCP